MTQNAEALLAPPRQVRQRRLGHIAVQVHPARAPCAVARDLANFIQGQPAVDTVEHDPSCGVLVVHYDERRGAARLLRGALLDRLVVSGPPPEPQRPLPLEVNVAHEVPGRLRLRLGRTPRETVGQLADFIRTVDGVLEVAASSPGQSVLVRFDPRVTDKGRILECIASAPPATWGGTKPAHSSPRIGWTKAAFSLAVLASAVSGVLPVPWIVGAVAVTAVPPFRRALRSLGERRVNVDVIDATAITVCLARAEPITASVITSLLAIGDLILDHTHARAHGAIAGLIRLDDGVAYLLDSADASHQPKRVRPADLRPDDCIVVYPGGRVPADGVIVNGGLSVDEKALTGESVPQERLVGDRVLAASVVLHGQAVVRVERAATQTVAARILQILASAGSKPMTLQRNAERSADQLVLPTFGIAGAAWALTGVIDRLTSVLITDFGTGVRVAVPSAALAAMTLAAREGVLVKGASFLERLSEVDTIVFDKTGTLTEGVPEVTDVVRIGGPSEIEIAAFAAAAEGNQSHPIAHAIRRHAARVEAPSWEAELGSETYRIGLGLEARVQGHRVCVGNGRMMIRLGIDPTRGEGIQQTFARKGASSLMVAVDGELSAVIAYADAARQESREVVAKLRAGGRRQVLLLSGDGRAPVEAIARQIGIDRAIGEVLPEQKAEVIRALKAEGRKVAMVGDGINDAPALALADIGISLHGASDVATETADVVLLEGGLKRLPVAFQLADNAMARVKQVLAIVLVPNAAAIAAGALGFISPVIAAVVNNGSTIAAAVHAIAPLLRRGGPRRPP
jgi:P-type Cu2+ transporter